MLDDQQLRAAAQRIAAEASAPAKVIVFGSYARGDAGEASDLDLLVIEPAFADKAGEYLRLKSAVGRVGVGVGLVLLTRDEYERRSEVPGTLPFWARREGKVLHDGSA